LYHPDVRFRELQTLLSPVMDLMHRNARTIEVKSTKSCVLPVSHSDILLLFNPYSNRTPPKHSLRFQPLLIRTLNQLRNTTQPH
jgi:hypothetical protein